MSVWSFKVEQRQVEGKHSHTWVAIDEANEQEVELPAGGNGNLLGSYPEIERYLAGRGVDSILSYSKARGDTLDIDRQNDVYTWTFSTAGEVVVKDIPRLVVGYSIET